MKPLHSRPFSIEHAKAGAPYSFSNGECAEVIKWDRYGPFSMVALHGDRHEIICLNSAGYSSKCGLVMLPLGMIDGKPVFTGDALISRPNGVWIDSIAEPKNRAFINCRWPAPAKVYPQTLMTDRDIFLFTSRHNTTLAQDCMAMASAAIRHAIDAGQVVIAAERDARDIEIAVAVRYACTAVCHPGSMTRSHVANIEIANIIATVPK